LGRVCLRALRAALAAPVKSSGGRLGGRWSARGQAGDRLGRGSWTSRVLGVLPARNNDCFERWNEEVLRDRRRRYAWRTDVLPSQY